MTLGRHALHYLLSNVFTAFTAAFALIFYTHALTAADYGLYFLTHTTAALLYSLLFGSISATIIRFCPSQLPLEEKHFINATSVLMLIISVATFMLIAGLSLAFHSHYLKYLWLGWLLFFSQGYFQISLDILRAKLHSFAYLIINSLRAVLTLSIGIGFIYWHFTATAPLWGLLLGYLIPTVIIYGYYSTFNLHRLKTSIHQATDTVALLNFQFLLLKKKTFVNVLFNKTYSNTYKTMLHYGLPLAFNLSFIYIISNTDRWLLALLCSKEAAGLYSAAFVIPLYGFTLLMTVVNLASFPLLVKAEALQQTTAVRQLFLDNFILLILLVCPVAVLLWQLPTQLITLLLGTAYQQTAIQLMPWLVLASLIGGIKYYYTDLVFMLKQKTRVQFLITLITFVCNIFFNYLFIIKWHMLGAIYGTTLALSIGLLLSIFIGRYYYALPFALKPLLKALLPAVLLSGLIAILPKTVNTMHFMIELLVLGLAYVTFCLVTHYRWFVQLRSATRYSKIEEKS